MTNLEKRSRHTKPQDQKKHPDRWEKDLNPSRLEGQNIGATRVAGETPKSAAHLRELAGILSPFQRDELEKIPIVPAGTRLKQGAVYLDLNHPSRGPITASAENAAGPENFYVAKAEIPYDYWNRLLEIFCPHANVDEKSAESGEKQIPEEMIDKALADSFPTSDPPAWNMGKDRDDIARPGEKPKRKH